MELTIDSTFSAGALVGHLSQALLIVSMLMTRMIWLRVFAIGSGLVARGYDIFWLFACSGRRRSSPSTSLNSA